jgi:cyclopropane fatty-acyl-phospholipid synthase-like methyltransferase
MSPVGRRSLDKASEDRQECAPNFDRMNAPPADLQLMRCPQSKGALSFDSETGMLGAQGRLYPLKEHKGERFIDFLQEGVTDPIVRAQKEIYEAQDNRYGSQLSADVTFMERFVDGYVSGGVKNKDALLRKAMKALPLDAGCRVIELGCNDGRFLNALTAMHRCQGVGIDVSERAIRRAIESRPSRLRTRFHVAQAAALPFVDESFDCAISFDVFEHLGHEGVQGALRECGRILKPGGVLLVYVISRNDRFTLHETFRTVSDGALGIDNQEGHSYENFLSPDEFRHYATEAGFSTEWVKAYHAFWTLLAEEQLGNRLPRLCYPLLALLDYPLTRSERGNGFLALARRSA